MEINVTEGEKKGLGGSFSLQRFENDLLDFVCLLIVNTLLLNIVTKANCCPSLSAGSIFCYFK